MILELTEASVPAIVLQPKRFSSRPWLTVACVWFHATRASSGVKTSPLGSAIMESIHFSKVKLADMSAFEVLASILAIRLKRVTPKTAH